MRERKQPLTTKFILAWRNNQNEPTKQLLDKYLVRIATISKSTTLKQKQYEFT